MRWQSVRLSQEDKSKLEAMAEQKGISISEVIRELIRNSHEQRSIADVLKEIRAAVAQMPSQNNGNGNCEDLTEIRRVVTLIGRAMPSVAKYMKPLPGE